MRDLPADIGFEPGAKLNYTQKAGTVVSGAVTIQEVSGVITSETSNLAADTTEVITLTNRNIKADSIVVAQVSTSGTGTPVISSVVPAAGTCTFAVRNVAPATALNAVYKIRFFILGSSATML